MLKFNRNFGTVHLCLPVLPLTAVTSASKKAIKWKFSVNAYVYYDGELYPFACHLLCVSLCEGYVFTLSSLIEPPDIATFGVDRMAAFSFIAFIHNDSPFRSVHLRGKLCRHWVTDGLWVMTIRVCPCWHRAVWSGRTVSLLVLADTVPYGVVTPSRHAVIMTRLWILSCWLCFCLVLLR